MFFALKPETPVKSPETTGKTPEQYRRNTDHKPGIKPAVFLTLMGAFQGGFAVNKACWEHKMPSTHGHTLIFESATA